MEDVTKELHKRSRNPKYKKKYRVTNWKKYEQSLCNRGYLTLWISPSVNKAWKPRSFKKRGRQQHFSDLAIETILSLRLIFHHSLRQTEGFVTSIFQLMKLKIPDHNVPNFSHLLNHLRRILATQSILLRTDFLTQHPKTIVGGEGECKRENGWFTV